MKNNILRILKQMFGSSRMDDATEKQTSQNSHLLHDEEYQPEPCDLLVMAGDSSLILTSDRGLGGLWNFIDFDPCSGSTSECLTEMKKLLDEHFEEAYDAVLFPIEEKVFLLNMADSINRGACEEDSTYYKRFIDDKLDVFYPVIKRFVEKNSPSKTLGIMIYFGGGTGIGLNHLSELLANDGFRCLIEGAKPPCSGKEYLSESLAKKSMGEYEEFDNTPYYNSKMNIMEYYETGEERLVSAMKARLRERMKQQEKQKGG